MNIFFISVCFMYVVKLDWYQNHRIEYHPSLESLEHRSACQAGPGHCGGVLGELLVGEGRHEAVGHSGVLGPGGVDVGPQVCYGVGVVELHYQS